MTHRNNRLWFLLVLTAAAVLAQGGPLDIVFKPGRFVYTTPEGFVPEKLSTSGLKEMQNAAAKAHYPFFIVFVRDLPTQTGSSTDDDAEKAIVGLADDWARHPKFDRNRSTFFLISYGPGDRKFRMMPAPLWRSELGLEYGALDPFNRIFTSTARQDPQSAIVRMMQAFDTHVFDNFDPVRRAQKAEELRQAAAKAELQKARAALDSGITEVDVALALDPRLLAESAANAQARVESGRAARGSNDPDVLHATARDLSTLAGGLNAHAQGILQREQAERNRTTLQWTGSAVGVGLLGIGSIRRRRTLAERRATLKGRLDEWREWISRARQRYFHFDENRERAPHLRKFHGKTKALYEATSAEIDAIIIGVEAVAARLDQIERLAGQAGFVRGGPLDEALGMLDVPFPFDTEAISDQLFEPETKTIEVTPSTFFAELSERYDAAIDHWRELNDAVTLSLHLADELFPQEGLDALLERAREHSIPERWLAEHPLVGDDQEDATLYGRIDARRLEDPYDFALQVEALQEKEAGLAHDVDRLTAALELARSNWIGQVEGLEETVLRPEDDPKITLGEAQYSLDQIGQVLATAPQVEDVETHAQETDTLFTVCRAQIDEAREAIPQAAGQIADADSLLGECRGLEQQSVRRLAEVAKEHTNVAPIEGAQSAAAQFLVAGQRDLVRARAKLEERRHLEASRDALRASDQFTQGRVKLESALDVCAELDAVKARYLETLAQMETQREEALRKVQRYNGMPSGVGSWAPPTFSGPLDYAHQVGLLMEQQRQWVETARTAQRAYEERERQRRAEEEAERQARHQSLFSSSSSSSFSSGGSFGGGGSGSSGGSFSGGGSGSSGGSW